MYSDSKFFENRQYQENRLMAGSVVPPLAWSCSPDTGFELSARQICCFSRYILTFFFSETVCTRWPALRGFPSCHPFHGQVLLIQNSNCQRDSSAVSPDMHTQYFFENCLFQENRSTVVSVVPLHPWSCSPDTRFEMSARQICCFSRYIDSNIFSKIVCIRSTAQRGCPREPSSKVMFSWYMVWIFRNIHLLVINISGLKFFRETSASGEPLNARPGCATPNKVMFSWHKDRIISQTDLRFLPIYILNIFSNIVCFRSTARRGVTPCTLFQGHVLLIQCLNFQKD